MTVPSNVIVGGPTLSVATIDIPGLAASPDASSPGTFQFQEEFDQNTTGVPAGWTVWNNGGGLAVVTNDALSCLHLSDTDNGSNVGRGIYRALPAGLTYPLTITMALSDSEVALAGFVISPVQPGSAGTGYGVFYSGGHQATSCNMATGALVGNGSGDGVAYFPSYMGATMPDNTHLNPLASRGGLISYTPPSAVEETLSGPAAYIALFVNALGGNSPSAWFDFIRIK